MGGNRQGRQAASERRRLDATRQQLSIADWEDLLFEEEFFDPEHWFESLDGLLDDDYYEYLLWLDL